MLVAELDKLPSPLGSSFNKKDPLGRRGSVWGGNRMAICISTVESTSVYLLSLSYYKLVNFY